MRATFYRATEVLAAVAGAWCVVEVALRFATGATAGLGATGLTALAAASVFVLAGARRRSLDEPR